MHTIQNIHVSLEIIFWENVISLMTNSPVIRKIIRQSYLLYHRIKNSPFIFKNFLWVYAGLSLGLVFGFISILI